MLALLLALPLTATQAATSSSQATTAPAQSTPGPDPELHDTHPMPMPANSSLPTLWIVGDSTVRNGHGDGANGQWGWGDVIAPYFDTSRINVVNRAIGGRSSRTYITEGRWQTVLDMMHRGDFVLVQFGHNDSGPLDDAARARGTLRGTGDQTQEVENPVLKRHETVHTYGWYMRQYIEQARAKGATVIVCTLIPRMIWKDGHIERSGADSYGGWAREIAAQEHAPVVDLNEIIARQYDAMGPTETLLMFGDPHTHTSLIGAQINAMSVVMGMKLLSPDPLATYLSPAADKVPATMPAAKP
ncbi:rhamnogalacturonan acetylesterase [Silvibacterium dinghuense]|uniref:Rhamnogalacturonan acetylesterase n=1 Tax=Silvibacterium dinghuense TaxID=1560006 RepID=A0A4Q1SJP8_9BACT|nr:rhamnogalacturonan acetylesterase [Silvibacterium dinghuense]RXS97655.1 rhamnogalacturonan acetylesterase [Silvibacterium dinghuense]